MPLHQLGGFWASQGLLTGSKKPTRLSALERRPAASFFLLRGLQK